MKSSSRAARYTLFFVLLVQLSCGLAEDDAKQAVGSQATRFVPLVAVLVDPEIFADQKVSVTGYLDRRFGKLFLTTEHAVAGDVVSAIFLSTLPDECMNHFVRVQGHWSADESGEYTLQPERIDIAEHGEDYFTGRCWPDGEDGD